MIGRLLNDHGFEVCRQGAERLVAIIGHAEDVFKPDAADAGQINPLKKGIR